MQLLRMLVMLSVAALVVTGCITAKPMEEKAMAAAPATGDEDGDGVMDDQDKCPGTRKGARVDHKGCEIVLTLSSAHFAFDSSQIRQQIADILTGVANAMNKDENKSKTFELAGHTDSTGPDDYNMGLGERRADAVREFLIDNGVSGGRLTTISYGESKPVASNDTAEGRAENRRVDIVDTSSN